MNSSIQEMVSFIKEQTKLHNLDNITRTKAYQAFYKKHPEIKWAFLASMVSRNAGWNMTDLHSPVFETILPKKTRKRLFSTYERANWLIFSDAFPQLILYSLSIKQNKPLFHHLCYFHVSSFMQKEWHLFWKIGDQSRLMTALIINEQNVIRNPVIQEPFYKKTVFNRIPYLFQDFLHMNAILFPNLHGRIFATDVFDFKSVTKRIELGKRLSAYLFHPELYQGVYDFAFHTPPTGSSQEYEQYQSNHHGVCTPRLRDVYPVVSHQDNIRQDWNRNGGIPKKWWKPVEISLSDNSWTSFSKKRHLLTSFVQPLYLLKK
ncbi:DUF2515 domain-containing protein [Radiobacillus kanasensis]|uniref:DUF2515 family protein n=1 Tax=Radiobacillus kanasensis TaxID=2844358 RepID=UPI001E3D5C67|nr:DUF2515 family protein [Radiobacillus kanasensis]UFU01270.1 DUF2515 domain-containing protein [Radiobacillus kanasensis]